MANQEELRFYPKNPNLYGVEFPARCMPDVSVKTRIIAVCGITNIVGYASPELDVWFVSDFFLFNHLLRKAPVANQIWLTCCEPKDLVEEYTRYAHGNPFRERRVVLEERLLNDIYAPGTLRVVAPNVLLDRFLITVKEECEAAVKNNQNVLLLVFGHGDQSTYGVTIGSNAVKTFHEHTAPRLRTNQLKLAVGKKAQCTLLMTSCYSGGWAMRPDLNLTIITAAGPEKESLSWKRSSSLRFSGSIAASAICEAIFETEIKDTENKGKPEMDDEELRDTETYAEMGCLIYDRLKQTDRLYDQHHISFAAQDDEWTKAWRARTGIPLSFFKQRWEELSIIPAEADAFTNRDPSSHFKGSFNLASLGLDGSRTGSTMPLRPTISMPQMYNLTRAWAAGYENSFPGASNLASNTALQARVRRLLSGEDRYENRMDDLLDLGSTLSYRLDGMAYATYLKDILGLDYPDCHAYEIESWTYPLYESSQQEAKDKLRRYNITYKFINDARLFSSPLTGQGWPYSKPKHYLAIALVESRKSTEEVVEAINILKAGKLFTSALCSSPQLTVKQFAPLTWLRKLMKFDADTGFEIEQARSSSPSGRPCGLYRRSVRENRQ